MSFFGRLDWHAFPFVSAWQDPTASNLIGAWAAALVVCGAIATIAVLTWTGSWWRLWSEWLTSLDHKRIGIMYIVIAFVMLARALAEGALMRLQHAYGLNGGFLAADHYAELFTTHGTIMIFFMAMPFLTGLMNFVVPLQLGARDVSFPTLNAISLGLTAAGASLVMVSLVVGNFSTGGWTAYPPYTGIVFSPGEGPDYWIWAVTLGGIGSTLTGINFAVTIYKERAPGMSFMRMPMFCWTALCASILMIFALPPLTAASLMLALDRYLDFHFFTTDLGGNMMNFANLFWLFGHPEVYILILPAFGVFSEVISTFSGKRLYGYRSLVLATMVIAVLSFTVWAHHFFTMGGSAFLNAVFGAATMTIAVPTGVKIYDWMATMYQGRIRLSVPMVYSIGFMMLFVIGGLTGIQLANPTISYQVHNTLFLVAHFHNMLVPGFLFGMLAGYTFWFPKMFGFRLIDSWGYAAAFGWIIGFMLVFFPLYAVGLIGMTRRSFVYDQAAFEPFMIVSAIGAGIVLFAFSALIIQLLVSIRHRKALVDETGDPWDGRSLEWSVPSPPPAWNFSTVPTVADRDAFAQQKAGKAGIVTAAQPTEIVLPANSAIGPLAAALGAALGFGLIWHIWWLALVAAMAMIGGVIAWSFVRETETVVTISQIAKFYRLRTPHNRMMDAPTANGEAR